MECPLLLNGYYSNPVSDWRPETHCLEGKCAWWDRQRGHCAILGLVEVVDSIGGVVAQ